MLDPADYPLFADSAAVAAWDRPFASPFEPHDGDWFLSAGADDQAYKRLLKPFDLSGQTEATFDMWTSFDLEGDYDYMFVEIHTVGEDDWTTLEDVNGHTSDDVGLSCPSNGDGSNWQSNHPFLAHYQTKIDDGDDCDADRNSGSWNAATGNSGGWQDWSMPIPDEYLGERGRGLRIGRQRSRVPGSRDVGGPGVEVAARTAPRSTGRPLVRSGYRRLDPARTPAARRTGRPVGRDGLGTGSATLRSSRRRS